MKNIFILTLISVIIPTHVVFANEESQKVSENFGIEAGIALNYLDPSLQIRASYRLPILNNKFDVFIAQNFGFGMSNLNSTGLGVKYYPFDLGKIGNQPFLILGIHFNYYTQGTNLQTGIGNDYFFTDNLGISASLSLNTNLNILYTLPRFELNFKIRL